MNNPKIVINEKTRDAIRRLDDKVICSVADYLRSKHSFNYTQTMEFFEGLGLDRDDVEGIFYRENEDNLEGMEGATPFIELEDVGLRGTAAMMDALISSLEGGKR